MEAGRELDALVAEYVKDWTREESVSDEDSYFIQGARHERWIDTEGLLRAARMWDPSGNLMGIEDYGPSGIYDFHPGMPYWSTDITAAIELIPILLKNWDRTNVYNEPRFKLEYEDGKWWAFFGAEDSYEGTNWQYDIDRAQLKGGVAQPAHAICLTALKIKGMEI